jgi:hypothetical protein
VTLTKTTTTNKMPTTTVNSQKKQPKMIAKWSGSDEPSWNDDNDGITFRKDIKWYDVHNHDGHDWNNEWGPADNDDVVDAENMNTVALASAAPPRVSSVFWTTPLSIASGEEPIFEPEYPDHEESSANFTFGVCCDCGVGLYDKNEFICCHTGANGHVNTCNACHNYHMNLHIGGEDGGCN